MSGVALVTHSTKPRGGLVHTLSLAEALHRRGEPVHLIALGDPSVGLFRPTDVPHTVLRGPSKQGTTLDERVFLAIDTLAAGLRGLAGRFDVLHAQDCIAARAAARVRDAGAPVTVVRTVHHVDDFTTRALIDCQRAAIVEPDRVLVVSEQWRGILRDEYGRPAEIVPNGVDLDRFTPVPADRVAELRASIGAGERFLFLSVGGVEPRKGSVHAFRALSRLRGVVDPLPVLAVVGGHSFQDYTAYRDAALAELPSLGLELGSADARSAGAPRGDVVLLGTVSEADLGGWYAAADAFAFPSVKEGFGLVVLEAMNAGLPVVASDLPVFTEYLVDGVNALLPPVGDEGTLAAAMHLLAADPALRERLRTGGRAVLPRFTWDASAARHQEVYASVRAGVPVG
ncbi:MAG: MSMEG_0565 family glycosyltransferase [Pseudonocardia sp.]